MAIQNPINSLYPKQLVGTPNSELRTPELTRRHFLGWFLGLSVSSFFPFRLQEVGAALPSLSHGEKRSSIGAFFNGEELSYEVGFWFFKRAALGRLSIRETEKKGQYVATLQGETLGVLGWVARYRVDTYRSTMEEIEGGNRLRSLSFEEDVKIGSKMKKKIHLFDYEKRKWTTIKQQKGKITEKTEEEIPPGMIYDDFITASYNFRYGVYGEIERGRKYVVPTFPRKGPSSYEVKVASKGEEEGKRKSEKTAEGKNYFISLFLDPEITHSKEGLIEGWLSKELCPVEGTIKDVVLFGDVKGTLVKKVRSS